MQQVTIKGFRITKTKKGLLVQSAWGNFKYYYPHDKYFNYFKELFEGDDVNRVTAKYFNIGA